MRKHFFVLVILLLIVGCSKDNGELRKRFESGQYRTLAAFGDSIVEGYRQPEGWPDTIDLGCRTGPP